MATFCSVRYCSYNIGILSNCSFLKRFKTTEPGETNLNRRCCSAFLKKIQCLFFRNKCKRMNYILWQLIMKRAKFPLLTVFSKISLVWQFSKISQCNNFQKFPRVIQFFKKFPPPAGGAWGRFCTSGSQFQFIVQMF
jgi:hypothetical protein